VSLRVALMEARKRLETMGAHSCGGLEQMMAIYYKVILHAMMHITSIYCLHWNKLDPTGKSWQSIDPNPVLLWLTSLFV